MRKLVLLTFLFLTACGYEETFSPTYHDSVCVPASALAFLEEEPIQSQMATDNSQSATATCCEGSWVTTCCFGGNYICADGSTGVGCGCPSN